MDQIAVPADLRMDCASQLLSDRAQTCWDIVMAASMELPNEKTFVLCFLFFYFQHFNSRGKAIVKMAFYRAISIFNCRNDQNGKRLFL